MRDASVASARYVGRRHAVLTARKIERAKAGRYSDGHGLYLIVHNANNKSFAFRWERDGRERWMGLGAVHTVDLKQARAKAREARLLLLEGVDPLDHRREAHAKLKAAKAKAITFAAAAQKYFDQHEAKWRNRKHAAQFLSTLKTYAYPALGDMPVHEIDTPAVLRALEPHWLDKTETMNRTRGRIESVLDWATVRGYRSGDNPARWRGHLGEVLPPRSQVARPEHHPALPYRELGVFMNALGKREGVAARALEFLILTCARTGEILGARHDEFRWDEKVWVVPAGRMKGGREHRVALSQRAIELLRALPAEDGNGFVFIGSHPGTGLAQQGMTQVLRRLGRTDISVHGFRSTFRDWAAEQTNFPRELAEMALAHKVGDKTERAYQRADMLKKRHALAEAWSKYASSPPTPATGAVVPMRRKGAAT
jgi:integrase